MRCVGTHNANGSSRAAVLYAEARGIFGAGRSDCKHVTAKWDRIKARFQKIAPATSLPLPTLSQPTRYLIVLLLTLLSCVAVAVVTGVAQLTFVGLTAAFALGLSGALSYVWVGAQLAARRPARPSRK
jgi:hypothetical protein